MSVPWFKRAGDWFKKYVKPLAVALVAMLGAGIFWKYHRGKIRSLEDQAAIEKAHRKVAALDARREALAERAAENAEAITAIQSEREAVQREAVALESEVADMSPDELENAFRELY